MRKRIVKQVVNVNFVDSSNYDVKPMVGSVYVPAKLAKAFRAEFYMSKTSRVYRPGLIANRKKFWELVHQWFTDNNIEYSDSLYIMLSGFSVPCAEIIMPHQETCAEGELRVFRNDLALVDCSFRETSAGGRVAVRKFYSLFTRYARKLGYEIKLRGCFLYKEGSYVAHYAPLFSDLLVTRYRQHSWNKNDMASLVSMFTTVLLFNL